MILKLQKIYGHHAMKQLFSLSNWIKREEIRFNAYNREMVLNYKFQVWQWQSQWAFINLKVGVKKA